MNGASPTDANTPTSPDAGRLLSSLAHLPACPAACVGSPACSRWGSDVVWALAISLFGPCRSIRRPCVCSTWPPNWSTRSRSPKRTPLTRTRTTSASCTFGMATARLGFCLVSSRCPHPVTVTSDHAWAWVRSFLGGCSVVLGRSVATAHADRCVEIPVAVPVTRPPNCCAGSGPTSTPTSTH